MTFIEVVLASALLGIVSMGVFGVLNYLVLQQKRAEYFTGAAEVANRVVIMFLDNPDNMPSGGQPIAYGRNLYRWTYEASPIEVYDPNATEESTPMSLARLQELTVSVWLHEDSGGAYTPSAGTPGIVVRRMLDPLANRNPDTLTRKIERGDVIGDFMSGGGPSRSGGSQAPGGELGGN